MSKTLFLSAIGILLIAGCTGDRKESPTRGWAHVVTSESIEPIVTREIEMFVDLYKDAHVTNRALPARSAVVEFFNVDSIKALITSRPLNEEEIAIANRTGLKYEEYRIALDAVAVIVHRSNGLSFLRTTLLDSIFAGLLPSWKSVDRQLDADPVMLCLPDQNSGEFEIIGKRILHGKKFGPASHIAVSSADMISYVAREPRAIGVASIAWLRDNTDSVNVVALEDPSAPDSLNIRGQHFTPIQGYIYKGYYPITTDVMIYSKADKYGVAAGFISFVMSAPGQKIFLNNGLVPATMPVRIVQLSNKELTQ